MRRNWRCVVRIVLLSTEQPAFLLWGGGIFIDGEWISQDSESRKGNKLTKKPEKVEVEFADKGAYDQLCGLCSFWSFLKERSVENIVNPEKTFDRAALSAQSAEKLTLFVPWGVRPDYMPETYKGGTFQKTSAERRVLQRLFDLSSSVQRFGITPELLIMPADVYAVEVNRMSPTMVSGYFSVLESSINEELKNSSITCVCRPWSDIRNAFSRAYSDLCQIYSDEKITSFLPQGLLDRAFKSAQTFNPRKGPSEQKRAAFSYLRERLCEAEIVDRKLNAIKVSCVDPMKDAQIDLNLPRLYVIPTASRFPWLKPV